MIKTTVSCGLFHSSICEIDNFKNIIKFAKENKETIIGVETHCSECGKELIHIINEVK